MIGSDGGYVPATPEKRPVYGGEPAEAADYPPPARALAGDETGSGTRSGTEPSRLPAGASDGTFGRRSTAIGGEDPVTLQRPSSVRPPVGQAAEPSKTAIEPARGRDEAPTVPPGREQHPVGDLAQPAPGTPFGSARFLLGSLPVGGLLVRQAREILGSLGGSVHGISTGALHGGSLTQRGPPLRIPSPFSGFGPVMGGAASGFGSSGSGGAPLLAVIVLCLFAVLFRGRSRAYNAFLRPGTVPRLALERPG